MTRKIAFMLAALMLMTCPALAESEPRGEIYFEGETIRVAGAGVRIDESTVTIYETGVYRASGTLAEGQIVVNSKDPVTLILNGVSLSCSSDAPIQSVQGDLTLTTMAGTDNSISDLRPAGTESDVDAAIFTKDDLTLAGEGALNVSGGANHGIECKDALTIAGGSVNVVAPGCGIRAKDSLAIEGGSVEIASEGDGLKASGTDEEKPGEIRISGGTVILDSGDDGLKAVAKISITGGEIRVTAASDGLNAGDADAENDIAATVGTIEISGGSLSVDSGDDGVKADLLLAVSGGVLKVISAGDGLKSGGDLSITGGEIAVDAKEDAAQADGSMTIEDGAFELESGDDAVNAGGDLSVSGGAFVVTAGDDAFHADGGLALGAMTANIAACTEGLEGATVSLMGARVSLVASDDGVNAASGESSGTGADAFLNRAQGAADGFPSGTPGELPEGAPEELPAGALEELPEGMPGEMPEGMPGGIPGGMTGEPPAGRPETIPQNDATDASSGDASADLPADTTADASLDSSAAGGTAASNPDMSFRGRGMMDFGGFGADESCSITIGADTFLCVEAGGDGLDSNGAITLDGGTVLVYGPTNGGNSSLDAGTQITVNGGLLIAAGAAGMVELPSDQSAQPVLCVYPDASVAAGTPVRVEDESGAVLCAFTSPVPFTCLIVSAPSFETGAALRVIAGGEATGEVSDGLYAEDAVFSGGEEIGSGALTAAVTTFGADGGQTPGGRNFGGKMGF